MNGSRESQVTLLPAQIRRLAQLPGEGAVRLTQNRNVVIHVNNGREQFAMDAHGNDVPSPNQERLC